MSLSVRESIGDEVGILFSPYGKKWRQLRAICTLELLSAKRVRSFRPLREEQVARLVGAIAAAATACCGPSAGQLAAVNVSRQIAGPMSDLAVRAIMGESFRQREKFLETLAEALKKTTGFSAADLFPSSRLLLALVDSAIDQHREHRDADDDAHGDKDQCLLSTLMRIQKEGDDHYGSLTMATVKAVILDMFSGGSETTSTTLGWAMSELARNPRVMQRAQAEVRRALHGRPRVTEDDLTNLKYPKNIIKETLRLHPVAPLHVPKECQEPRRVLGHDVPRGTVVFVNAWAIGRDPRYWDDAEAFMPERFEQIEVDLRGTHFELIPFGAGRRMCPGLAFAHAIVELALAALLYHFDWHLPPGVTPDSMDMEEGFGLTVSRKRDLYLHPILHVGLETVL
ncbi:hypothetical protein GUJ93_ZPchr0001g30386 [Zizania palustris]|uniref:Uncharacterized protein n=1 Tax=Zizania palustris TaxID=103762 RepID=A0A8J5RPI2_ZIZPA|nr:hypothetical protein GUJ93_ZPchr0001g30386 [Zizania palustris]